jgi:hypothetical protein
MHYDKAGETVFNFNSDIVHVTCRGVTVEVPAKDLVGFVINRMRDVAISRLEQVTSERVWQLIKGR